MYYELCTAYPSITYLEGSESPIPINSYIIRKSRNIYQRESDSIWNLSKIILIYLHPLTLRDSILSVSTFFEYLEYV